MEPIRTGTIGFGRMAEQTHLARMRQTGLYDVVGVCDITPEHALRVMRVIQAGVDSSRSGKSVDVHI